MTQMATIQVQVPIPLLECGLEQTDLNASINETIAVKLFERGCISSGAGARMLGISRPDFFKLLHQHGVAYLDYTREELERDYQVLHDLLQENS